MRKIILLLAAVIGITGSCMAQAQDTQIYKGDFLPSYKVIVSSVACWMPWGIWSTTQPAISDDTIAQAGFPAWQNDWLAENQGDGNGNAYNVWTGTDAAACRTSGNKETYRILPGANITIGGRSTAKLWLRTLGGSSLTTVYFMMTGDEIVR